jgi:hypothetical protein
MQKVSASCCSDSTGFFDRACLERVLTKVYVEKLMPTLAKALNLLSLIPIASIRVTFYCT